MNDQETKNIVEAMEQWKKMHEITADDIRDYIRIPRFSKSKKEKMFDIVRKIGVKNSKSIINFIFTSGEYKRRKLSFDITEIMMDIDYNVINHDSLYLRFIEECEIMIKSEFDILNSEFAYEECFSKAYKSILDSECRLLIENWAVKRIPLNEWKELLMDIAQTDYIKVNLPPDEKAYKNGNGEGVFVMVDVQTKNAHDNNESGTSYSGILDNDSIYYDGLVHGTTIPFEMRGKKRPIVPYKWLVENYGKPETEN